MNNSIESIKSFNKKLNIQQNSWEKSWKKSCKNREEDEDVEIYNNSRNHDDADDFIGNDNLMISDYHSDDNNMIVRAVNLKKSKNPIENRDFGFVKRNKSFATTEAEDKSDSGRIKNSTEDTFHRAVGPILFIGQCFAIMPVRNVLNSNPKLLKFSYKSIQFIGFLFFICSSSILTITQLINLIKIGIVGFIFNTCCQCSCTLFASLATRWPKMLRYWSRIESSFTQPPYETPKRCLSSRVRFAAYSIIVCSAVEHGLIMASAFLTYSRSIELCAPYRNYTQEVSFEGFLIRNFDIVYAVLPFNIYFGVFILIINIACTFNWNYMDLFLMMISKGLAYRFEQITARINKLDNKEVPETVFTEIREHYVKLCEFLEFIDENLAGIILLSCANNLYFICYQLLNVFNKLRWPINYIYFWYSLFYLIGRTVFVFLTAASINEQAKGGLVVLRKVSARSWCAEVERLIFQMTTHTVALSGKKFFYLTKRLLFGMVGTIVTYELVLLQFDEANRVKGLPDLCA